MSAIAAAHSEKVKGSRLSDKELERPVDVRDYLERSTLIESKEKEALAKATNAQALEMNFKGIFLDEGRRILG